MIGSRQSRTASRFAAASPITIGVILLLVIWMATRPYRGVVDDSRFYTIQAVRALLPATFDQDLYFRYGSQDQFTIFTKIYAPFIAMFGLSRGNLMLTMLSQMLWLGGAAYFILSLIPRSHAIFALAGLVMLPGGGLLYYGEPCLTPRILTEAMTFWALGCMLRQRPVLAGMLLLLSVFIHPLMTFPGLGLFFLFEAARRPRLWGFAALGAIGGLVLAFANVEPFARLLLVFDPEWLRISETRDFWCFISRWDLTRWATVANMLSLAGFTLILRRPKESRVLELMLVLALCGLAAILIGGFLDNVFIVDAQPWRVLWLLSAITNIFAAECFLGLGEQRFRSRSGRLYVLALTTFAVSAFFKSFLLFVAPVCLLGMLVLWLERRADGSLPPVARYGVLIALSVIAAFALIALQVQLATLLAERAWATHWVASVALCTAAMVGFLMLARYPSCPPRILLVVSPLLLVLAASNWDQRSLWEEFVYGSQPPADLIAALPASGAIYWEGDVDVPWFLLKRPSQFSCEQGTGALFSRGTALAFHSRAEIFGILQTIDFRGEKYCPPTVSTATAGVTVKNLAYVCAHQPGLGALVLTSRAADAAVTSWTAPVPFQLIQEIDDVPQQLSVNRFYIYRCKTLSTHLADPF